MPLPDESIVFLTAFLVAFGAHPVLEPLASATDPPKSGTCYREEKDSVC